MSEVVKVQVNVLDVTLELAGSTGTLRALGGGKHRRDAGGQGELTHVSDDLSLAFGQGREVGDFLERRKRGSRYSRHRGFIDRQRGSKARGAS